uniref:Uncharacterized protein n=1 Tax=Sphaerodactylus townsendi TaxID=933632 RepID=A0ACB8F2B8_9SAUR
MCVFFKKDATNYYFLMFSKEKKCVVPPSPQKGWGTCRGPVRTGSRDALFLCLTFERSLAIFPDSQRRLPSYIFSWKLQNLRCLTGYPPPPPMEREQTTADGYFEKKPL